MQQMRLSGLLIHVLRKPAFATRCFTSAQTVDPAHRRATASRDNFPEILPFLAAPSDTTHVIKKKNDELRNVLKTLQWPRLRAFEVAGHIYRLPLHSPAQRVRAEATVQYLGGFFDGDGCVKCPPSLSGCTLAVGQSVNRAGVLLKFLEIFGGSITRHSDGVGLWRPTLVWSIGGVRAREAARVLATASIAKKAQLLLAAEWPTDKHLREECKTALCALKQRDSAVPGFCTLEYFTGFFDADGTIRVDSRGRLTLEIRQKHSNILRCLHGFGARHFAVHLQLRTYTRFSQLSICGNSRCKAMLYAMLKAGLSCKAELAELALGLSAANVAWVRAAHVKSRGNQGFGKKLDEEGRQRSILIASGHAQVRRWKQQGKLAAAHVKSQEIAVMKSEHERLSAHRENLQLSEYVRKIQELHGQATFGQSRLDLANTEKSCTAARQMSTSGFARVQARG